MACLIDQVAVFNENGKGQVTCPSSLPEPEAPFDFSVFSVSIGEQNLNYVGIDMDGFPMYAAGGTADNPILPGATFIHDLDGCFFATTFAVGEHHVSMCSSESDDACPDVPFSESAPEKYADYFNEDGVFVPKADSGGGDCAFTMATLSIVDENGAQPEAEMPDIGFFIPRIDNGEFICSIPESFGDFAVPLYNGVANIQITTEIISHSGNIEVGRVAILTGDATISVPTAGGE